MTPCFKLLSSFQKQFQGIILIQFSQIRKKLGPFRSIVFINSTKIKNRVSKTYLRNLFILFHTLNLHIKISSNQRLNTGFQNKNKTHIHNLFNQKLMSHQRNQMKIDLLTSAQGQNALERDQLTYEPRLHQFLCASRDLDTSQIRQFQNKSLLQILRETAQYLNREQSEYNRIYTAKICNFILITKRPSYFKFIRMLKQSFYSNLPAILRNIVFLCRNSQQKSKSLIILKSFLKILSQIHQNDPDSLRKTFSVDMLKVLQNVKLENDRGLLRIFLKLIFQIENIISKGQKSTFSQVLIRSLKYSEFPAGYLIKAVKFIENQLPVYCLLNEQQKACTLQNLRSHLEIIRQKREQISEKELIDFIRKLNQYQHLDCVMNQQIKMEDSQKTKHKIQQIQMQQQVTKIQWEKIQRAS